VTTRARFISGAAGALVLGGEAAQAQIVPMPTPLNSLPGIQNVPTVSFAVAAPLSGDQKPAGLQLLQGTQQAAYDANLSKAPTDPLFNVRMFDDQGSLAGASLNAQFIINDQTIIGVIGHLGGRITDQVVPRYGGAVVPLIVPASTYDPITSHGYRTVFRLPTKDSVEGQLYALALDQHRKPQKVVVFAQDGDYGPDVAAGFMQQAAADKVSAIRINVPSSKADYRAVATRGLAEQPDFVFFAGLLSNLGPVLDLLNVGGYSGLLGASQGFFDPNTISRYGKAVEGLAVSTSMPPLALAPASYQARNNYESQFGPMTPVAAFGYAAAQLIILLVRQTGSNNRLALARALNASPGLLATIVGNFSFGPTGDPLNPEIYFYAVTDGKWEYSYAARPTTFLLK
jgi:branched-chain amino acid transport system substrate-binding protein